MSESPSETHADFSHAVINPRLHRLIKEEEDGSRSAEDILDELSTFIEETKEAASDGVALVTKMNLLKHLYGLYYDLHRKTVDIPSDLLRG